MVYTPDFSAIETAFTSTWVLGAEWLIPIALALIVMASITRNVEKWKILFFPILILEMILGMPVHYVIVTFAGLIFVIETQSVQILGNIISAVKKYNPREKAKLLTKAGRLKARGQFGESEKLRKAKAFLERAGMQEKLIKRGKTIEEL